MGRKINYGFTIVEVLIVFFIISLFSGFAIAQYNTYTRQKKFEQIVLLITSSLDLAKSKARASDRSLCQPEVGVIPMMLRYEVVFSSANSSVVTQAVCIDERKYQEGDLLDISPYPLRTDTYDSSVVVSPDQTIAFGILGARELGVGELYDCVEIKNNSDQLCKKVTVTVNGLISSATCSCGSCCQY